MFLCWEVYMSVNYIKDGAICFAILVHNVYKGINSLQNLDRIEFVPILLRRWFFFRIKVQRWMLIKKLYGKKPAWSGGPGGQITKQRWKIVSIYIFQIQVQQLVINAMDLYYQRSLESREHHYWDFGLVYGVSNSTLIKMIGLI